MSAGEKKEKKKDDDQKRLLGETILLCVWRKHVNDLLLQLFYAIYDSKRSI